ncbi:MAG: sulfate adenylyltransferase, partial [Alphaproteobacteria bacterium]|nr:sulfate adenylyltransferase [Alphaproteobacteria bacterium]
KEDQVNISGTKQREMLSKGEAIPPEFSRPEVVKILQAYYQGLK